MRSRMTMSAAAAAIALLATTAQAQPADAAFEALAGHVRSLDQLIAGGPTDVDAIIEQVGLDSAALAAWVYEQVEFEHYSGIMKGPTGTLVAGRANAADQALLLATLLESAGVSAELVRGTLPVGELPAATMPPPAPPASALNPGELAILAEQFGTDPDSLADHVQGALSARQGFLERLWARTLDDLERISHALDEAGVPVPGYTVPASGTVTHWWVSTAAGDFDPVLGRVRGQGQQTYVPASLPDEAFHRLTVRLMIESAEHDSAGPRNAPEAVLDVTLRTAELFGHTVALGNVPLDAVDHVAALRNPQAVDILEALAASGQFQPQLITPLGTLTGHPFDLTGQRLNVRDGRIEAVQEVGRAAGRMVGGIGGALGGRAPASADEEPATVLVGHWLELELHAPALDGEADDPVRIRRELLNDADDRRQAVLDILATRELLVMPDQLTGTWLTRASLRFAEAWADFAKVMLEPASPWLPERSALDLGVYADRPQLTGPLYAFGVAQRTELRRLRDAIAPQAVYWRDQPMIVSYVRSLHAPAGDRPARVIAGLDILHNTLAVTGDSVERWPEHLAFASGILDTALELAVTGPAAGGERRWNTSLALERALAHGELPRVVLDGPDPLRVYVSSSADEGPGAWYCVSPTSGTSLGMIEGGGGQAMTEYAEKVATILQLKGLLNFYKDLFTCLGLGITLPLSMDPDAQRGAFNECVWDLACGQVTGVVGAFVNVETNWTNMFINWRVGKIWSNVCGTVGAAVGVK